MSGFLNENNYYVCLYSKWQLKNDNQHTNQVKQI